VPKVTFWLVTGGSYEIDGDEQDNEQDNAQEFAPAHLLRIPSARLAVDRRPD
jgi:hypothetical protein